MKNIDKLLSLAEEFENKAVVSSDEAKKLEQIKDLLEKIKYPVGKIFELSDILAYNSRYDENNPEKYDLLLDLNRFSKIYFSLLDRL